MDLHMLVLGLGKERTAAEFSALLARAGFAAAARGAGVRAHGDQHHRSGLRSD